MILEFSYVALSILMTSLVILANKKMVSLAGNSSNSSKTKPPNIIIPIVVWLLYVLALAFSGFLRDYNFPPRFPLFLFLPFFLLTVIFFFKHKDNPTFKVLPLQWTTFYQSFRVLVEMILLYTFYKGIIPEEATFEGYNFDILIGISAIILGLTLAKNPKKYKTVLILWNIIGIMMVLFVGFIIGTSIYYPEVWLNESSNVSLDFVSFPYILIPGFLAPSAIFMHVVSLIQIRVQTK